MSLRGSHRETPKGPEWLPWPIYAGLEMNDYKTEKEMKKPM
jgi:hypothetical protein